MRIVNAFRLRSGGRRALLGDAFDTNRPYVDPATPRSSVQGEVVRPGVCRPESSRVGRSLSMGLSTAISGRIVALD